MPEIKLTTTTTTIISLKSHKLAKSRNFRSQKSKVKTRGAGDGGESTALDGF